MGGASTSSSSSKQPKYPKKPPLTPDPDAPKIARPCSECGKKFWSWKALFGHMRCHPERQWRGINPPPNFRRSSPSLSQKMGGMTEEDHEVAACLLLLANNAVPSGDPQQAAVGTCSICSRVFSSGRALGGHKRFHCRDNKFRGGGNNHNIHQPPILCSSSSTNNYLDFNLNLVPTPTPAPAPHHQDHSPSSSAVPLGPTLDLSLGL
nr:zinc finger protein ZAT3-like [Ipomoea batatas]